MERKNVVKVKGSPVTLSGEELRAGQRAPDFVVLDNNLKEVKSGEYDGKIRLIASVPSLDTPVCDAEIHNFNKEAAGISKDVVIIFISMDLPFAQKRFCQDNDIDTVKTFSDHRDADFGLKYGVLIKELRLLARAIFIIDKTGTVKYVEYVPELSSHPNYKAALSTLKDLAG
ncbi:MAG: thiol peroxidase [Candidatus Omnitrophica bacterium]|nr:thiol peroxidase [Candidatus Omnitrophota bacterium]